MHMETIHRYVLITWNFYRHSLRTCFALMFNSVSKFITLNTEMQIGTNIVVMKYKVTRPHSCECIIRSSSSDVDQFNQLFYTFYTLSSDIFAFYFLLSSYLFINSIFTHCALQRDSGDLFFGKCFFYHYLPSLYSKLNQ